MKFQTYRSVLASVILVIGVACTSEKAPDASTEELSRRPVPFKSPIDISAGSVSGVSALCAADFDGDGRLDVAVIDGGKHATQKTFAWFKAPGKSGEENWERFEFSGSDPLKTFVGAAMAADMDNDGDMDLVVSTDLHSGPNKETDILIFLNPLGNGGDVYGDWNYVYVAKDLPYHHINDMEITDMDKDGKLDIIARSLEPNEIHVFFQNTLESWEQRTFATELELSEGLAVGDLNGDGYPEIAFTGFVLVAPQQPRTREFERIAIDPKYHTINQNTKECIGDIDGDGRPDLLLTPAERFRNGNDHHLVWYKNPGGDLKSVWEANIVEATTNNMHTVKLALMDGDLFPDIVSGIAWDPRSVAIYYNNGDGTFTDRHVVADDKGLYSGVVVDFDGDGDLDIVGQDKYSRDSKPYVYESLLND